MKPFSVSAVGKRIKRIAIARKPFVAANGYIGPVRTRMDGDLGGVKTFEPPNALDPSVGRGKSKNFAASPEFQQAQRRLTLLRLESCTRAATIAARALLEMGSEAGAASKPCEDFREMAADLRRLRRDIPSGNLRDVIGRLAALMEIGASDDVAADRARKLIVEISEAVSLIVTTEREDMFAFPADIIQHMDSRFPTIAMA